MSDGETRRILVVSQTLEARGGANSVLSWLLQALNTEYRITLLVWDTIDFEAINSFYGTTLEISDFRIIHVNAFYRWLAKLDPDVQSLQPAAYLMRHARRLRPHFDLVISAASEEMDLGSPSLLYIHYPYLARFSGMLSDTDGLSASHKFIKLLMGRIRPWMCVAGFSLSRLKKAIVLTNSEWTARQIFNAYGLRGRVVYPAVTGVGPGLPWDRREDAFLAVGRFQASKRFDFLIAVLRRVREEHPNLRLHIVGTQEPGKQGHRYYLRLLQLVEENASWVELHERLPREEMLKLAHRCRYGIHATIDEHFGLAPAELLLSGCIVFVHNSGGQVEIVGREQTICYHGADDAVGKIQAVMIDPRKQEFLRALLAERAELFGTAKFIEEISTAVNDLMRNIA